MTRHRAFVLTYPVDLVSMPEAIALIEQAWLSKEAMHVVTLDAEMSMQSRKNPALGDVIKRADLVVPDGAGVVFALKAKGGLHKNVSRLPGIELADRALAAAAQKGVAVALIGGRPEVMQKLTGVLKEKYPTLNLVAYHDGYFKPEEEDALVASIAEHKPGLVLIALGVPRQEFFINKHRQIFGQAVLIGVGGSFDVWTGFVQRAPKSYQDMHLEWLYRLQKEPWRFSRMATTLPAFALLAMSESLTGRGKPTIQIEALKEHSH